MIRHVVMFRWHPEFPEAERVSWLAAVRELPSQIGVLRSLSAGVDTLGTDRSWDAAIVAEFDTIEDVATYTEHPAHRPLITISGTGAAEIASVDFII
ncbi:Dabb family protein [Gordonia sp. OPL2]|uniref:Dabb family protein n=1 Tax=Gordonia sp. OPL2 TaxID=2486274 RepID=UPI00165595AD|nr:Dabb family protein [Gordonia sp. OPL2]